MPRPAAPAVRLAVLPVALLAALLPGPAVASDAAAVRYERELGAGEARPRLADEGCLDAALAARPAAAGLEARLDFTVDRDGRTSGLELDPPGSAAVEAAVRGALDACRWIEGRDRAGQAIAVRVSRQVQVRRPPGPQPGGAAARADRADEPGPPPPPVVLGGGSLRLDAPEASAFRRPVPEDPACLPASIQREKAAAGVEARVKFAVLRDGSVSHFTFFDPVTPEAERAVVAALRRCRWRPAADPAGEPLAAWVVQPIKVAPLPPPPEPRRPLFP